MRDGKTAEPASRPRSYRSIAGFEDSPLFDRITTAMRVCTDEIFGPVLSVVGIKTCDAAMELVNVSPHGNSAAIITDDRVAARHFQNEVEVGMVGTNVPVAMPMALNK